jgi:bacteriocin biosynthesis cyclodehydratase domain-containing protein
MEADGLAEQLGGVDTKDGLRVAEGLDLVPISDNEVLVQFGSRSYPSQLLRDTDLTGVLGRIVSRLELQPATVQELVEQVAPEHRDEAKRVIENLRDQGILTEVGASAVDQYLAYTFTGETRLAEASVSLVGAGPLGARIAEGLLQHGVGRVRLLDGRDADDVWRMLVPLGGEQASPVRGAASELLRERLDRFGYSGVERIDAGFDDRGAAQATTASDLTVMALEQPDIRMSHLVNRCSLREGRPWLHVTLDGNIGVVGPLFVPGTTACYSDFQALLEAAVPSSAMARRYRRHAVERGVSTFSPGLPAHAEILAGFASLALVHFMLRGSSFALGRALSINFDRMMIDVEDVLKLPRCPVCGAQRSAYQPPFSAEAVTRTTTIPQHE